MMVGRLGEHREHRAAAQRMPDHRVNGFVRAQDCGQAVTKARQVGKAAGRSAVRRCIDTNDREAGAMQWRDEVGEARGM